ncbi:MAG: hypothetical protein AAFY88_17220, partial [Acidobacteriota bacterium]
MTLLSYANRRFAAARDHCLETGERYGGFRAAPLTQNRQVATQEIALEVGRAHGPRGAEPAVPLSGLQAVIAGGGEAPVGVGKQGHRQPRRACAR